MILSTEGARWVQHDIDDEDDDFDYDGNKCLQRLKEYSVVVVGTLGL